MTLGTHIQELVLVRSPVAKEFLAREFIVDQANREEFGWLLICNVNSSFKSSAAPRSMSPKNHNLFISWDNFILYLSFCNHSIIAMSDIRLWRHRIKNSTHTHTHTHTHIYIYILYIICLFSGNIVIPGATAHWGSGSAIDPWPYFHFSTERSERPLR